jgi:hypothetical protein
MRTECTKGYELHLHKLRLNPDQNTVRNVLMATRPEPTVQKPYRAYVHIFL